MKQPVKYAYSPSDKEYFDLKELLNKSEGIFYKRIKGILLSMEGYSIDEISDILDVHRNSVSLWIDLFKNDGFEGLEPKSSRSGRKPILTESEQEIAIELSKKHPRNIKMAVEEIKNIVGKEISTWTLKRLLKKSEFKWKRVRKSLKGKQDSEKVKQAKKDIEALEELEDEGEIKLSYFDESGFDLTPVIPYAWQESGRDGTIKLPSSRSHRINVLGFMDEKNNLTPFVFENTINSRVVVACFDKFANQINIPTVVIIDNASIHTGNEFSNNIEKWQEKGLYLYFLPPYSPELNKIEILWRKMKYEWMPFSAYENMTMLRKSVDDMLINFGSVYKIHFA